MFRFVYNIQFKDLILIVFMFCLFWCISKLKVANHSLKMWKQINFFFFLVIITIFIYFSLIERNKISLDQWPTILWSYKLAFIDQIYDYFQEIYLNILSFFFIGLFASELCENQHKLIIVLFLCVIFSISIEWLQYILEVGLAEIDDVISNFIGSILGVTFNFYGYKFYLKVYEEIRKWKRQKN